MKLYTKRGDDGTTGLIGGQRITKDDLRVCAYGEVDEANAALGAVIASCDEREMTQTLQRIQSDLFILGAELSTPTGQSPRLSIDEARVIQLERWIDKASAEVPPLQQFVLPGGSELASRLHLARTICRRAERATVTLAQQQAVGPCTIVYLNRLSDLLFALARLANARAGIADIPWIAPESAPSS